MEVHTQSTNTQERAGVFDPTLNASRHPASNLHLAEETPDPADGDATLEEAVRDEREYVRRRLHEELQREPTEAEIDEWLRQHTEGY